MNIYYSNIKNKIKGNKLFFKYMDLKIYFYFNYRNIIITFDFNYLLIYKFLFFYLQNHITRIYF